MSYKQLRRWGEKPREISCRGGSRTALTTALFVSNCVTLMSYKQFLVLLCTTHIYIARFYFSNISG
jgi:hypothetical protein